MATPDDDAQAALPLPGLGDDAPSSGGLTPLETAARRSLAALHAAGVLEERHAVNIQLVLDLSRAVGRSSQRGQAAAAAMAAAQLREAWALLPQPIGNVGDEWDDLARFLRDAAANERRRHALAMGLAPGELAGELNSE